MVESMEHVTPLIRGSDGRSGDDDGEVDNHDHAATISDEARRLGKSAYQAMGDSEREGDMCIVEKSYIIIGTRLVDQSLFFCALQNLIDMERKVSMCYQKIAYTSIQLCLNCRILVSFLTDKHESHQNKATNSPGRKS